MPPPPAFKDIVILPIQENMNNGKTHAFFSWAANHSWVPPIYFDNFDKVPKDFTYLNATNPAPALATHDPVHAHRDRLDGSPQPWVRPDFVVKADDDSFVMLAELEARLRVELHKDPLPPPLPSPYILLRGVNSKLQLYSICYMLSLFNIYSGFYETSCVPPSESPCQSTPSTHAPFLFI